MEPVIVAPSLDILGEGPTWAGRTRKIYWVDIKGRRYHSMDLESGKIRKRKKKVIRKFNQLLNQNKMNQKTTKLSQKELKQVLQMKKQLYCQALLAELI